MEEILFMPGDQSEWNLGHMLVSIAGLCPNKSNGEHGGASQSELIRPRETDQVLFLETSARAGAARIPESIEAAAGVNVWTEWAKLKSSIITGSSYSAPEVHNEYAGSQVSSARQEWPDTSVFSDPEVVWNSAKRHHAGLAVRSPGGWRVAELIDSCADFVRKDFHVLRPLEKKLGTDSCSSCKFMMVGC